MSTQQGGEVLPAGPVSKTSVMRHQWQPPNLAILGDRELEYRSVDSYYQMHVLTITRLKHAQVAREAAATLRRHDVDWDTNLFA
jgi:hypothetical protein